MSQSRADPRYCYLLILAYLLSLLSKPCLQHHLYWNVPFLYPAPLTINTLILPPPFVVYVYIINGKPEQENPLDTKTVIRRGSTQNYPMPITEVQGPTSTQFHHFPYHPMKDLSNRQPIQKEPPEVAKNIPAEDYSKCGIRAPGSTRLRFEKISKVQSSLETPLSWSPPDLSGTAFAKALGQISNSLDNKITFGLTAGRNEFPWQAAILKNGGFHCGGSLIAPRFILTAAHCVEPFRNNPSAIKVSLGDHDLISSSDGQNTVVGVESITPHPSFTLEFLQGDIAVVKLSKAITFNKFIRPVCLPPTDLKVEGHLLTVSGWGRNENKQLMTTLRKLSAFAIENRDCATKWALKGAPKSLISTRIVCMNTQFGDTCKGDSGGPSVMEHPAGSGSFTQAGIVSFGAGTCLDTSLPGVYTRVPAYVDWIKQTMAKSSIEPVKK